MIRREMKRLKKEKKRFIAFIIETLILIHGLRASSSYSGVLRDTLFSSLKYFIKRPFMWNILQWHQGKQETGNKNSQWHIPLPGVYLDLKLKPVWEQMLTVGKQVVHKSRSKKHDPCVGHVGYVPMWFMWTMWTMWAMWGIQTMWALGLCGSCRPCELCGPCGLYRPRGLCGLCGLQSVNHTCLVLQRLPGASYHVTALVRNFFFLPSSIFTYCRAEL